MRAGFIGLGNQGGPLARNVVAGGFDVAAFDVRPEALAALVALGAKGCDSPAAVARLSEIIQICVLDDAQLESALAGPEGVLAGAAAGTIIAVHSTVSPSLIERMADLAAESGVELIDAPVSGGHQGAVERRMSYMVGGSEEALARCRPLFQASGEKITHTGGVGTAIKAKLAHQIVVCGNMLSVYEGMRAGQKAGLSPEILHKIMHEGYAQSRVADDWFSVTLRPHSIPVFYKDLQLCLKFARELGIALPGAALAQQLIDDIVP
jgi:3-hydroxyisobutyrate dehydrogenase-like beta-hydroxyacid dehydrogenase